MSERLKCPHCRDAVFVQFQTISVGQSVEGTWQMQRGTCPACLKFILQLERGALPYSERGPGYSRLSKSTVWQVHPRGTSRSPCPAEVPTEISADYLEACLVLGDSRKASAALSRRCLQNVLRTAAGVEPGDLAAEIQQVLDAGSVPSHLTESLDAVRNIGNFAAHPLKSTSTGAIVDVETGEAEWTLDVLESLFDFFWVQPAILRRKREALNAKLSDHGKPPMKG